MTETGPIFMAWAWHDMTDNYLLMQWDNSYLLTHAHFGIYDFMRFIY